MILRDCLQLALDALLENDELDQLMATTVERHPELTADIHQLREESDAQIARLCGILYLLDDPTTLRSINRAWMTGQIDRLAEDMADMLHRRDDLTMQIYWQDEGGEGSA